MPWWQYDDDETRDYHDHGRLVRGDVVEADQCPDTRFVKVTAAHARRVQATPADQPIPTPDDDRDAGSAADDTTTLQPEA